MKRCTKCGVEKPIDEFYVRSDRRGISRKNKVVVVKTPVVPVHQVGTTPENVETSSGSNI